MGEEVKALKATRGKPVGVVLPQGYGFEAMRIEWMNIEELSEAIPPAYSKYIGEFAMQHILEQQGKAVTVGRAPEPSEPCNTAL